ncbi:RCC1 domain-containing protein [Deinococcus sp.]|uniref:RCC1 domain-containing protein n=1 Tax=Deinococcus sp. TaxID=47478 RepID=UPI003CC6C88D
MNKRLILTLPLTAALLAACGTPAAPTSVPSASAPALPPTTPAPASAAHLGQLEVTFSVDKLGKLSATSRPVGVSALSLTGAGAITLTTPALTQATFTTGSRTGGGLRYLSATFALNNTGAAPLSNVSLVAVATPDTTAGTAVKNLTRFDDTPVTNAAALARQVIPTQHVYFDTAQPQVVENAADFQVYTPADLSAFAVPAGETLLPYGYVAHSGNSRTLAPGSAAGQVTVSVKLPLQPTSAQDAFSFSMLFEVVTDSTTRVTEGLEEQGAGSRAAVQARAARFGASDVYVLPGSSYDNSTAVPICTVPLNVPGGGPDAFLVNDPVTGVTLDPTRKLLTKNANTRIPAAVSYASGRAASLLLNMTTTGAALSSTGGYVKGLSSGTGTVKAAACGVSSADLAVRVIGRPTIGAGSGYSVVIKPDGTLTAWGQDNNNIVSGVPGGTFEGVYAGDSHALAVKTDSSVLGWGRNSEGQTTIPAGLGSVLSLSAGDNHSLALKADGSVVGWGYNGSGQATTPAGLSSVTSIAAGNSNSYAVKSDGTVAFWGNNSTYSGGGSDSVPAGLNNVIAVANGALHHLALKSDGTVVGWGYNGFHQSDIPAGLNNVVAVADRYGSSFALKSDGTVVGWGDYGAPGQVLAVPAGLSNVVSISASPGGGHVLALKADGSLVSWGNGVYAGGINEVPAGLTAQLP